MSKSGTESQLNLVFLADSEWRPVKRQKIFVLTDYTVATFVVRELITCVRTQYSLPLLHGMALFKNTTSSQVTTATRFLRT